MCRCRGKALLDEAAKGNLPDGEIALVLASKPDAYALTRAEKAGVPGVVVARKQCASQAEFEEKILDALREYKIEMIVFKIMEQKNI